LDGSGGKHLTRVPKTAAAAPPQCSVLEFWPVSFFLGTTYCSLNGIMLASSACEETMNHRYRKVAILPIDNDSQPTLDRRGKAKEGDRTILPGRMKLLTLSLNRESAKFANGSTTLVWALAMSSWRFLGYL
jgi:hypothetical protein